MKRWLNLIFIVVLAILVGIQFIRPARNNVMQPTGKEIAVRYPVPDSVERILQQSCYDCHSNNTRYPWYANVQPVGWFLNHHITEGKHELNFDEFAAYAPRKQFHKFEAMEHEVNDGDMPLESYLLIHRDAKLSPEQTAMLVAWSKAMRDSMKVHFPADSLKRLSRHG